MKNIQQLPDDSILKNEYVLNAVQSIQQIDLQQYLNLERLKLNAEQVFDLIRNLSILKYINTETK